MLPTLLICLLGIIDQVDPRLVFFYSLQQTTLCSPTEANWWMAKSERLDNFVDICHELGCWPMFQDPREVSLWGLEQCTQSSMDGIRFEYQNFRLPLKPRKNQ